MDNPALFLTQTLGLIRRPCRSLQADELAYLLLRPDGQMSRYGRRQGRPGGRHRRLHRAQISGAGLLEQVFGLISPGDSAFDLQVGELTRFAESGEPLALSPTLERSFDELRLPPGAAGMVYGPMATRKPT
jgi:hypothetical protein